jgi:hypothetical protein
MKFLAITIMMLLVTAVNADDKVFICNSKGGKRYHLSKECRGLSNCKAEIKEVTLEEAKSDGKTLCGYEK